MLKKSINIEISNILDNGDYILGKNVFELENKLSSYVGVKHCLSCASGTDALLIPLMAKNIGEGDVVFTTSFSFFATAEVIALVGATPVFIDIEEDTFNINPLHLEEKIKEVIKKGRYQPKCLISVNLFGMPANYDKIVAICSKYKIFLIEDGAQSFGSMYKNKKSCSFGDVGATSFYPAKPLGCYGDGGAIFTNNSKLYHIMKSIRVHGEGIDKYHNDRIGLNSRLDTLQASILIEKMKIFDSELKKRNKIALEYMQLINDKYKSQFIPNNTISSWAQFSLLAENEDQRSLIIRKMSLENIPVVIYYAIPLHLQPAFSYLNYKEGDCPISEKISKQIFSIPMHPYLKDKEIKKIISILNHE